MPRIAACVLCLFLSACASSLSPISEIAQDRCHYVSDERTSSVLGIEGESAVKAWLSDSGIVDTSSVSTSIYASQEGRRTDLFWVSSTGQYAVTLIDNQAEAFGNDWANSDITIQDLLDCLGPPDSYIAYFNMGPPIFTKELILYMFYPDIGTMFKASYGLPDNFSEDNADVRIPNGFQDGKVSGRRLTRNTTSSKMLEEYLRIGMGISDTPNSEILARWWAQQLKPWPEAPLNLEFTRDPMP